MSSIRKMKRQMLKDWAREGKKPAEEMAKAAAFQMRDIQVDTTREVTQLMIHSMALVLMQNYKALQKRDTRLENFVGLLNQKAAYLKGNARLTREEQKIVIAANEALNSWWSKKREEDEQNVDDQQEKE